MTSPDAPRSQLDSALSDLVARAQDVLAMQGRLRTLLRVTHAVTEHLDLETVLQRIVDAAVELVGARYGALGVISPTGGLEQFIHRGMDPDAVARIGHLPEGHGLLGALTADPQPIRLEHLAHDPRSAGFPPDHPPMESFLGVPVRVHGEIYGNLYLTNSGTGKFSDEDEQLVIALAGSAGFAIDHARLFAETRRRQAWSAASAEITAALLSEDEAGSVALLASRVLTLSEADLVYFVLPTDDPEHLLVGTARGLDEDTLEGSRIPVAGSIAGSVLEGRQPQLIDDDREHAIAVSAPGGLGPTMAVPLLVSERALGALVVARVAGAPRFSASDLEMAADFAGQASVALELGRARAAAERLVLLEDRSRIAQDLHDHVIQQLYATGLQLQSVVSVLPEGKIAEKVDQAVVNLDRAITQIRTEIFALSTKSATHRPETARHRIIDIVNDLGAALANAPRLTFAGPIDLVVEGDLADDVVAVVRESLTNVVRHAAAHNTAVTVTVGSGIVALEIVDDGVGISDSTHRSGLHNLEARATRNGGTFECTSTPGETRILWSVPFANEPRTVDA